MPSSYAILGATGNTGQSLLKLLLKDPNNKIHAYCRSKSKLIKLSPEISDSKQVHIFEGSLNDNEFLANCLSGTRAVFLTVAINENMPGCSIALDTAHSVVSALETLKAKNERLPKLIVLSSASLDHSLKSGAPEFFGKIVLTALSNVYDDLRKAEAFLRSRDDLVTATFVRPGALCHDTQKGHALSMTEANSPISYMDVAAGMVEIADDDGGRYDMKGVAVIPTGEGVAFPWEAPMHILLGLLFHFFPWMFKYLG